MTLLQFSMAGTFPAAAGSTITAEEREIFARYAVWGKLVGLVRVLISCTSIDPANSLKLFRRFQSVLHRAAPHVLM